MAGTGSNYVTKIVEEEGGNNFLVLSGGKIIFGNDPSSDPYLTRDAAGNVVFTNLPTADPLVAGALWDNSGALSVSAG